MELGKEMDLVSGMIKTKIQVKLTPKLILCLLAPSAKNCIHSTPGGVSIGTSSIRRSEF